MPLAKNGKIHIAGPLVGAVQKCTRCHARIDGNKRWPTYKPSGWREGAEIYADRYGMSVVEEFGKKYACVRKCGREGVAEAAILAEDLQSEREAMSDRARNLHEEICRRADEGGKWE